MLTGVYCLSAWCAEPSFAAISFILLSDTSDTYTPLVTRPTLPEQVILTPVVKKMTHPSVARD